MITETLAPYYCLLSYFSSLSKVSQFLMCFIVAAATCISFWADVEEFFGSSTVSQTTTGGPSHNRLSLCWLISTLWPIEKNNSSTCLLGAALLIMPYVPASNLFFPVGFVLAERVLYLPSIGYCLLVSIGFKIIDKKLKSYSSDEVLA